MTADQFYKISTKFWQGVVNKSEHFKGKEKDSSTIELIHNLATLDTGKAVKSKIVSVNRVNSGTSESSEGSKG